MEERYGPLLQELVPKDPVKLQKSVLFSLKISPELLQKRIESLEMDCKTGIFYSAEEIGSKIFTENDEESEEEAETQVNEEASEEEPEDVPYTSVMDPLNREIPAPSLSKEIIQRLVKEVINDPEMLDLSMEIQKKILAPLHCCLDATIPKQFIAQDAISFLHVQRLSNSVVLPRTISAADTVDQMIEMNLYEEADDYRLCLSKFNEYCPVSMFEKNLQLGSKKIALSYKGMIYLFANEENQRKFFICPELYISKEPKLVAPKLMIIGAPGSGKTALSAMIAQRYKIPAIDVSSMIFGLFSNTKSQDNFPAMEEALSQLEKGNILSSDVIIKLIENSIHLQMTTLNVNPGWVLDGYPFTSSDVAALLEFGMTPIHVIILHKEKDETNEQMINEIVQISLNLDRAGIKVTEMVFDPLNNRMVDEVGIVFDPFTLKAIVVNDLKYNLGKTLDYCPVTLHMGKILQKGTEKHMAQYHDKIYMFGSEQNLHLFLKEPELYLKETKIPPPRLFFCGPSLCGKVPLILIRLVWQKVFRNLIKSSTLIF